MFIGFCIVLATIYTGNVNCKENAITCLKKFSNGTYADNISKECLATEYCCGAEKLDCCVRRVRDANWMTRLGFRIALLIMLLGGGSTYLYTWFKKRCSNHQDHLIYVDQSINANNATPFHQPDPGQGQHALNMTTPYPYNPHAPFSSPPYHQPHPGQEQHAPSMTTPQGYVGPYPSTPHHYPYNPHAQLDPPPYHQVVNGTSQIPRAQNSLSAATNMSNMTSEGTPVNGQEKGSQT